MGTADDSPGPAEGQPADPSVAQAEPGTLPVPEGTGPGERRVDVELLTLADVQRSVWRLSREVTVLVALAVLTAAGAVAGFWLGDLSPASSPEFESVAAGGLMALAGIVPAVLAAVASGRPVTRLDRGRLMLRGAAGSVVAAYCLVWSVAFVLPLLALVEAWDWLKTPVGIGVQLGLLVLATLGTPIVFLVLAARLSPEHSTLLAARRAIATTEDSPDVGDRCDLVKDLRDLAMDEHKAGDRRAVRHRMAGLATIAAHTRYAPIAHLAFDELGLVCQKIARDRDLALEGIALLRLAVDTIPPTEEELLRRAVEEAADIWGAAARSGASLHVTRAAAVVAIDASLRSGPEPLPALAALLREMSEATGEARAHAVDQIGLLDRSIDPVRLPASNRVVTAWVVANRGLGADGFVPLVRRIAQWTSTGRDTPRSVRPVIAAAADIVLSETSGTSLGIGLRQDVKDLVKEACSAALCRVGAAALLADSDVADPGRGVLFAELVRNWSWMSADDLDAVVKIISATNSDVLLDRCAPALLVRLDALVPRSSGRRGEPRDMELPVELQPVLVGLVSRLRSAAVVRDPSLASTPPLLDEVTARLVDAALVGALTDEAALLLRRRSAALVQLLDGEGAVESAPAIAAPLVPVLLASDGDYGASWLLWWVRRGGSRLPARTSTAWNAGMVLELMGLRLRAAGRDPATPLEVPVTSPLAGHGWTSGDVVSTADHVLGRLQVDLPSAALAFVFTEVRRWVGEENRTAGDAEPRAARAARLGEALRALPSLPADDLRIRALNRHRSTLRLWERWVMDKPHPDSPRERALDATEVLRSPVVRELVGEDEMTREVLAALCVAWCARGGSGPADPEEVAAVVHSMDTHRPVRAAVTKALRTRTPLSGTAATLLDSYADDVLTLARQVEMATGRRPEVFDRANRMLRWALEHPDTAQRRDGQLLAAARSLSRTLERATSRPDVEAADQIRRTAAALLAIGRRPDARRGAREALSFLEAGPASEESPTVGAAPFTPPPVPSPRRRDSPARRAELGSG